MSFHALAWAAKQKTGGMATKATLMALANYADENGCAYPSTAAIAEFGEMDNKTATASLDRLVALELITDSGERAGRTKQIKVYRLALESPPKTEAYQKRKPSGFSAKAPQKRGTDTVREPISQKTSSSSSERAPAQPLSDASELWNANADEAGWKRITKLSPDRQAKLRARLKDDGMDGWAGMIAKARASPLLSPQHGSPPGWFNFDFAIKPGNFLKIIEGNYDQEFTRNGNRTANDRTEPRNPMLRAVLAGEARNAGCA